MRLAAVRAVEMRHRDEAAERPIAAVVLGIERQPVDRRPIRIAVGSRHAEQGSDDRLNAQRQAGFAERHGAIEAVAVGDRDGGEPAVVGELRHRLGLDRALQHGIGGQNAKRDVGGGHAADLSGRQ